MEIPQALEGGLRKLDERKRQVSIMKQKISIGSQDFTFLREHNCFLVDKTDFIKSWWESGDAVTLITRPRRFGKTLNMSMLNCFFSLQYQNRGDLFDGLSVWSDPEYRSIQGTYPVIYLSFADVKQDCYADTVQKIRHIIGDDDPKGLTEFGQTGLYFGV